MGHSSLARNECSCISNKQDPGAPLQGWCGPGRKLAPAARLAPTTGMTGY